MGVAAGVRGTCPRFNGVHPSEIEIFKENFLSTHFTIFLGLPISSKRSKSDRNPRRNQNLGLGGLGAPESVPPSQNFVATPRALHINYSCSPFWPTLDGPSGRGRPVEAGKAVLRSRSRDPIWSQSESTVLARVKVGAGVSKMLPTPTSAWSRRMPRVNRR